MSRAGRVISFSPPKRGEGQDEGVSRKMNAPVEMSMANHMLYLHFRLIRSAPGQKAEAKSIPAYWDGERRQGRAAMRGREMACLPGDAGLPLGQRLERATPYLAKFGLSAFFKTGRSGAYAVSVASKSLVSHAIMPHIWNAHLTDEVPRCPGRKVQVKAGYKPHAKGWLNAPVAGTFSPRPRFQGCQQRQSRHGSKSLAQRQNHRVSWPSGGFMELVSPLVQSHQMARQDLLLPYQGFAKKQLPIPRYCRPDGSSTIIS